MRRPRSSQPAIDGGMSLRMTSPRRRSITTKSDPMTSWSSQKAYARGARS